MKERKFSVGRVVLYVILIFWAVFMIMPFAYMLLTTLKTVPESMKVPIVWVPKDPQWQNYYDVFTKYNFSKYYLNTAFVT